MLINFQVFIPGFLDAFNGKLHNLEKTIPWNIYTLYTNKSKPIQVHS